MSALRDFAVVNHCFTAGRFSPQVLCFSGKPRHLTFRGDERPQPVADNPNYAYLQDWVGLRAGSMLDIAAGVLVLASVGIFLAHAVDTYRAQ